MAAQLATGVRHKPPACGVLRRSPRENIALLLRLKGSARVQGELRFTQAQEQAKELTDQYKLQMSAFFLENANLELEMLHLNANERELDHKQ